MIRTAESETIARRSAESIAGGVVSLNRKVDPAIVFVRAQGSRLWDADGNEYIDYHAAFAPHLLGHNDPGVNHIIGMLTWFHWFATRPWSRASPRASGTPLSSTVRWDRRSRRPRLLCVGNTLSRTAPIWRVS